jgi:hypothetical protein
MNLISFLTQVCSISMDKLNKSASKIQKAWRKYHSKQILKPYISIWSSIKKVL